MTKNPFTIATARRVDEGFTLAELLVSLFVLGIIVFSVSQLTTSAIVISRHGNKHISTDTQARTVFDRMALDFAQMLKRIDVDYYVKGRTNYKKGNGHAWGKKGDTTQPLNDQIAFYSQVPGYYASSSQSPISIISYRVNQNTNAGNAVYLKLERLGRGLSWNGTNPGGGTNPNYSMIFLPITIGSLFPAAVNNNNNCGGSSNSSCDPYYETLGPGVFRMEYYYVLKNGKATDVPWDADIHTSIDGIGLGDVEAIAVVIAVIDSASRALINAANVTSLFDLASDLSDFPTAHGRGIGQQKKYVGMLENEWIATLFGDSTLGYPGIVNTGYTSNNTPVPKEAVKAIRIYGRTFDLKTLSSF